MDKKKKIIPEVGEVEGKVHVKIGPQFLNLFSEQLYSSPNKAFEELVTNSWDAGARVVYVGVPDELESESSTVWILDDGESMDFEGLELLWQVGNSPKRNGNSKNKRSQVGKFGIGKLATYPLANELTYICKGPDGIIRMVTMDYRRIDEEDEKSLHIEPLPLEVHKINENDVDEICREFKNGNEILEIINNNIPVPDEDKEALYKDFGGEEVNPPSHKDTWTLAILSSLKTTGKEMQAGRIRWILRTALPLGNSFSIKYNGKTLTSSKTNTPIDKEWIIGPDLGIDSIETEIVNSEGEITTEQRKIVSKKKPYKHVEIEGIGKVTGKVKLFADKISGGKSDDISQSNGFFINILGRVINYQDPYFGLDNLNHAAWAKFRATVRADKLDELISVTREDLKQTLDLKLFKAFLKALFNKARREHNKIIKASWPKAGDVLTESWHAVPLESLRRTVSEGLKSISELPNFIEMPEEKEKENVLKEWEEKSKNDPGSLIENVEFLALKSKDPLVSYSIKERKVILNKNHPYVLENSGNREAQELIRTIGLVELLTDFYMIDVGVEHEYIKQIREYRDQMLRLMAQVNRRSGVQIADMLINATRHPEAFEEIVGDAIEYLGFDVQRFGGNGEPEGIAIAPTPPKPIDSIESELTSYSFTYDAKSTTRSNEKVKSGNIETATLVQHREDYDGDFTLVIAPDYEVAKKLLGQCKKQKITPIRAKDLARMVILSATYGPLNLEKFQDIFEIYNPDKVEKWVSGLVQDLEKNTSQISYRLILDILKEIGYTGPNSIHIGVIADRINTYTDGTITPTNTDIINIFKGLEVISPSLVRITSEGNVFLSTSPQKLEEDLVKKIDNVESEYRGTLQEKLKS